MSGKSDFIVTWRPLDQFLTPVPKLLEAAAQQAAGEVRKAIQRGAKRTGRRYRLKGRKGTYRASAKGQPPAVASGALVKGITHSRAYQISKYRWACDVGTTAKSKGKSYPAMLEVGTTKEIGGIHSNRILPRPVWIKTLKADETQKRMRDVFRNFGKRG